MQKMVMVPIQEWEQIRNKNSREIKQTVTVAAPQKETLPTLEKENFSSIQKNVTPQKKKKKKKYFQENEINHSNDTNVKKRSVKNLAVRKHHVNIDKFKKKKIKTKAILLYKYLKEKSQLQWNKKGEILFHQNPIKGSNIVELVNDALKTNSNRPQGYEIFYKQLKKTEIPKYLLQKENA